MKASICERVAGVAVAVTSTRVDPFVATTPSFVFPLPNDTEKLLAVSPNPDTLTGGTGNCDVNLVMYEGSPFVITSRMTFVAAPGYSQTTAVTPGGSEAGAPPPVRPVGPDTLDPSAALTVAALGQVDGAVVVVGPGAEDDPIAARLGSAPALDSGLPGAVALADGPQPASATRHAIVRTLRMVDCGGKRLNVGTMSGLLFRPYLKPGIPGSADAPPIGAPVRRGTDRTTEWPYLKP